MRGQSSATPDFKQLPKPDSGVGGDRTGNRATERGIRARDHNFGLLLLAGVSLAFTLAVLLFTPMRMSLAWDENVNASQISQHIPMLWSAERARGLPLLIAPVTLFTQSATVLRVYLTLLAGLGLFAALLCWRRLRPDWVLALAGLVFGGLWVAESEASRVHPSFWIALAALAGVGLFLRSVNGIGGRGSVVALAVATAFATLMRPTDAVVLLCPLLLAAAVLVLQGRTDWRAQFGRVSGAVTAIVIGLAVGIGEWVVEAFLYFRGPVHRLSAQGKAVGGTKFDPINSLRILSGGRVASEPGRPTVTGWSDPWLLLWWLALGLIAILGIYATWRAIGWLAALTPACCAACEYLLYSFPVRDNYRYLLPAWALLAIPAADGLAWLLTRRGRVRPVAVWLAAAFLVIELGTQHAVLHTHTQTKPEPGLSPSSATDILRQRGVTVPCVVSGDAYVGISEPVAYDLGCTFEWSLKTPGAAGRDRLIVLARGTTSPYPFTQGWPVYQLGDDIVAYVQPAGQ